MVEKLCGAQGDMVGVGSPLMFINTDSDGTIEDDHDSSNDVSKLIEDFKDVDSTCVHQDVTINVPGVVAKFSDEEPFECASVKVAGC